MTYQPPPCPVCGAWTEVLETRRHKNGAIKRRIECANLHRFTDYDRQPVQAEQPPPAKPDQAAPLKPPWPGRSACGQLCTRCGPIERENMTAQENQPGLKARIEKLLDDKAGESLTLGQISAALDLPKTMHAEISSCLSKLRDSGAVKSALGPASSARGRRFVKRYSMAKKQKEPKVIVVSEMDARRALAFTR